MLSPPSPLERPQKTPNPHLETNHPLFSTHALKPTNPPQRASAYFT
ncbi:hypothetical protein HHE06_07470 [Helicobacter heilmannii]|nr:hypothetical protein HHE06_07470 [Helicobacter heilmannii]